MCVCVYIYVYIYVCIYVYIYIYISIYWEQVVLNTLLVEFSMLLYKDEFLLTGCKFSK